MTRYAIEYLDEFDEVVHAEFCDADAALDAASLGHMGLREARAEFGAWDFRIRDPATGLTYPSNPHGFEAGDGEDEENRE